MKNYEDLGITCEGRICVIEIQCGPHNYFDESLLTQLADAFEVADQNSQCRVLVLSSEGKNFSAGGNFGSGDSISGDQGFSESDFATTAASLYKQGVRLFSCKKPVVGAIQGAAVGGGLGLALVPDFRVVSPETRFSANFVKLGLHQGFGLSYTLPRLIGEQKANMMLLTGRSIKGTEAIEMGLADVLTEVDDILEKAKGLALELAENAPLAVLSVRETLRQSMVESIIKATERELAEQTWLRATDDAQEGVRAVAERRPGNFTGK